MDLVSVVIEGNCSENGPKLSFCIVSWGGVFRD
jgi:hypothetical protein